MLANDVMRHFRSIKRIAEASNVSYDCALKFINDNNIPFLYQKSIELYTDGVLKASIEHDIFNDATKSKKFKTLLIQKMVNKSFWKDIERRWLLLQQS